MVWTRKDRSAGRLWNQLQRRSAVQSARYDRRYGSRHEPGSTADSSNVHEPLKCCKLSAGSKNVAVATHLAEGPHTEPLSVRHWICSTLHSEFQSGDSTGTRE